MYVSNTRGAGYQVPLRRHYEADKVSALTPPYRLCESPLRPSSVVPMTKPSAVESVGLCQLAESTRTAIDLRLAHSIIARLAHHSWDVRRRGLRSPLTVESDLPLKALQSGKAT